LGDPKTEKNMIDRKRWGLTPYREKPKKWTVEELSEEEFASFQTVCKVCDHPVSVKVHKTFQESFLTGFWGRADEGIGDKGKTALEGILEAMRGMATCDRCYRAREQYIKSRDNILEVANWKRRLFDPVTGMSRAEPEDQKAKQNILISWFKQWSEALRKMTASLTLIYCDEMAGIIWRRPNAADYYLDLIEQSIYDHSNPKNQEARIKQIYQQVCRYE